MFKSNNLSHDDAMKIIALIRGELEKSNRKAAIAVTDSHGELLAFLRIDGCPFSSIYVAMNKAFTAARERKDSKEVGEASKNDGFPMTNFGNLRYTAWGGGVPVRYNGEVIGGSWH